MTQCVHRMLREAPTREAAVDAHGSLDWRTLADRIARFAGMLRAAGLEPGDRVAMLARNGTDYLVFVMGTFWAGGVINPVNIRWTPGEIAYSLDDCGTRFLIADDDCAEQLPAIRAEASTLDDVIAGRAALARRIGAAEPVADAVRQDRDLAAILYTGGTTGRPKGVMLSHANLRGSLMGVLAAPSGLGSPRYLHIAPLFHIGALSSLFIALYSGSTSLFLPAFDAPTLLEAIERWRVNELFLVPTMLRMVIDHPRFAAFDTRSVQRLRYGAAAMDAGLMDRALQAFPGVRFSQAYGMTETAPIATVLGPEDHDPATRSEARLRSAGRPTPATEVMIADAEDREVPTGMVGEILVRGPGVMMGYWNLPEASARALRGGWMHTGDLGRMDADGYVTVVDRLKDMIITGGENVYSVEVEGALALHPQVAQAAVIALPDPHWGERVHAVIVPRPGVAPCPDDLATHCRALIAGFKVPRSFDLVDALPLSAAGKVLKNVLRDNAARRNAG